MNRKELMIIAFLFALAFVVVFCGCDLKEQDVQGYEPSCQVFIKCLYLNQNNPDKTVCNDLGAGCKSANDFKACQNNTKMDFRDCLLLMRK